MKYQQKDHDQETPTDYFNRKLEVLHLVHDLTDPETIMEIMRPSSALQTMILKGDLKPWNDLLTNLMIQKSGNLWMKPTLVSLLRILWSG